jgi:hypothetical protein
MDDSDRARAREIFLTAASIVDPTNEHHFRGTMREATDVLIAYAADMRVRHDVRAMGAMTRHFLNSQPERIAEMLSAALLRLAEQPPDQRGPHTCPPP